MKNDTPYFWVCIWLLNIGLAISLAAGTIANAIRDTNQDITVNPTCLQAEDSAAHLKLVSYSESEVVYDCYRSGY